MKPGSTSHVFLAKLRQDKRLINHVGDFIPWGTGGDRAIALGPDGGGLGGAAAHRQFRLGRYHLDVLARVGGRRKRAVAVSGAKPNTRQCVVAALVAIWSVRLRLHIALRTAPITDDPRYAALGGVTAVGQAQVSLV